MAMSAERAEAIVDVVSVLAWADGARAVPLEDVRRLATAPSAPRWLVAFAAFREAIEHDAPEPPYEVDDDALCLNCMAAEAEVGEFCRVCAGFISIAGYKADKRVADAVRHERVLEVVGDG